MRADVRARHVPDPAWARWRAELTKALGASGLALAEVARRSGLSVSHVSALRRGLARPGHDVVVRLAEALTWEGLVVTALARRMAACEVCGAPFLSKERGGAPRRYCGGACKGVAGKRARGVSATRQLNVVSHRLGGLQAAVLEHCLGCEPDGLCRTPTCAIQRRGQSPLPLAREVAA